MNSLHEIDNEKVMKKIKREGQIALDFDRKNWNLDFFMKDLFPEGDVFVQFLSSNVEDLSCAWEFWLSESARRPCQKWKSVSRRRIESEIKYIWMWRENKQLGSSRYFSEDNPLQRTTYCFCTDWDSFSFFHVAVILCAQTEIIREVVSTWGLTVGCWNAQASRTDASELEGRGKKRVYID